MVRLWRRHHNTGRQVRISRFMVKTWDADGHRYIRLASDLPSRSGWLFSKIPLTATNWEVRHTIQVQGQDTNRTRSSLSSRFMVRQTSMGTDSHCGSPSSEANKVRSLGTQTILKVWASSSIRTRTTDQAPSSPTSWLWLVMARPRTTRILMARIKSWLAAP
jgi:hypothetical protein